MGTVSSPSNLWHHDRKRLFFHGMCVDQIGGKYYADRFIVNGGVKPGHGTEQKSATVAPA